MSKIKVSIIGAGSSYTPELFEKLSELRDSLPVKEIVLFDINEKRLEIMEGFCKRFIRRLKYDVALRGTTDRKDAIEGADFVCVQLRVGGNAARVNDEKIPLKYGLVGQETTGAGGMMKALRTIPVMLDIAHDVEKYSPNAWIINYTNPTGLVAEAVCKYSRAKIAGLCSGGLFAAQWTAKALGVDIQSVRYDYVGLNHMNFSYNVTVDGRPITEEEFDKIIHVEQLTKAVNPDVCAKLGLIPSPYLQYYYHTSNKVKHLKQEKLTRGEVVQLLEKDVFSEYADPKKDTKPESLKKRGGGGYSDVAIGIMDAIHNNRDKWMVINVPNQGAIKFLQDDAVIECGCLVNKSGIHPIVVKDIPPTVWGLVSAVKNYEQLAVEAAVTGDRNTSLLALMAHPLVRDFDIAKPLLNELLEVNKGYLPLFYQ